MIRFRRTATAHRLGLWAPLHYLAHRGLTYGIARLLKNSADVNVTDGEGRTPFHTIACHLAALGASGNGGD